MAELDVAVKPSLQLRDWGAWLTTERAAYGVIAVAALGLRFHALGSPLLGPDEARQALAAFSSLSGESVDLAGLSPLLHTAQRLLFALFGSSEFAARWFPALVGGLAPLLFWVLRGYLTRWGALAAAGLWAISPIAVFSGRQGISQGLVPPLLLGVMAFLAGAMKCEDPVSARRYGLGLGISAGMLLLSGSGAYTAILGGLAMLWFWWPIRVVWQKTLPERRTVILALAGTWILVGSFLFSMPAGLAASAGLLTLWLRGLAPGAVTYGSWELLCQLLLSEPLLLGFGIAGAILAFRARDRFGRAVACATGTWLAVALVGRGRHPGDLALVALGLVLLAGPVVATVLRNVWSMRREPDAWLLLGISLALVVSSLISLPGIGNTANSSDWRSLYATVGGITLTLAIAVWIVYGALGNWRFVRRAAPAVPLLLALLWGAGQLTSLSYDRDPWRNPGIVAVRTSPDLRLLRQEVVRSGALAVGGYEEAAVDVIIPSPSTNPLTPVLRWVLREESAVTVAESLGPNPAPIVITEVADQPALASRYVGAEFLVLDQTRPVSTQDLGAVLRWVLYRETRVIPNGARVVLWVDRTKQ